MCILRRPTIRVSTRSRFVLLHTSRLIAGHAPIALPRSFRRTALMALVATNIVRPIGFFIVHFGSSVGCYAIALPGVDLIRVLRHGSQTFACGRTSVPKTFHNVE